MESVLVDHAAARRMADRQAQTFGGLMNGRGAVFLAASGGTGGLAVDRDNVVTRCQRPEGWHGKVRCSHENHFHEKRRSFSAFATSILRRKGDR